MTEVICFGIGAALAASVMLLAGRVRPHHGSQDTDKVLAGVAELTDSMKLAVPVLVHVGREARHTLSVLTVEHRLMQDALKEYACHDNWSCLGSSAFQDHWNLTDNGWTVARDTLGKLQPEGE